MKTSPDEPYHAGARHWQDRFDSRRLADRLAERLSRSVVTADDRAFIARQALFFLATADGQGQPDVSYKGGRRTRLCSCAGRAHAGLPQL